MEIKVLVANVASMGPNFSASSRASEGSTVLLSVWRFTLVMPVEATVICPRVNDVPTTATQAGTSDDMVIHFESPTNLAVSTPPKTMLPLSDSKVLSHRL